MAAKRELIDTGTDKRYVRRNKKNQFKESDDVGRSLSQDVRRKAKTVVKAGYGDKGDQKRKWNWLRVTVRDEAITVMLPGTWFTVTYRKVPDLPDLVATNVVEDRRVAVKKADFLVRASRIANNKARELGWIV
jgi:hypothetical protein